LSRNDRADVLGSIEKSGAQHFRRGWAPEQTKAALVMTAFATENDLFANMWRLFAANARQFLAAIIAVDGNCCGFSPVCTPENGPV